MCVLGLHPTPPLAQAHAHETHAQTQAHDTHAQAQLASWWTGSLESCFGGGAGKIEFVNFSRFTTKLFAVFSMELAMLFAKSAPGIVGGGCPTLVAGL
jgi:hypothetical protein